MNNQGHCKSAIILLSAGLDSLVNTAIAFSQGVHAEALTFDYGQKAARQEIARAREICRHYGIRHHVIELPWFKQIACSALVEEHAEIPNVDQTQLSNDRYVRQTARAVWVPNRNGVFINIAAAYAEADGREAVIVGFNREEAQTFPDNTAAFRDAATAALRHSTANAVSVISYTIDNDKQEIVRIGKELHVPFELCWPCYRDGDQPCGTCESCVRFNRALERNIPV